MLSSPLMYLAQGEMLCYQKDEEVGPSYLAKKGARILLYSLTLPLTLVDHIVSMALFLILLPFHYLFPTNPLVDRLCYLAVLQSIWGQHLWNTYQEIGVASRETRWYHTGESSIISRAEAFGDSRIPFFSFGNPTTKEEEL